MLWTDTTKILIDCGLGSMKNTRQILEQAASDVNSINAVIVSHMHFDHISHYPLRVIESAGVNLWAHEGSYSQMQTRHFSGRNFTGLKFNGFSESKFEVGDIIVQPLRLPHQPGFATFGFVFQCKQDGAWKKVVTATDFSSSSGLLEHFKDADLVFLESNHDLDLLRKHPNPNSIYHLCNPEAGRFLFEIQDACEVKHRKVMLGHISTQRNTSYLAEKEIRDVFASRGANMDFELSTAAAYTAGPTIEIQ